MNKKPEKKKDESMDLIGEKTRAKARMDKVVSNWFITDPMMLQAWCVADKVADPKQKTMGIDSKTNPPVVRYNPLFVNALNEEQLECIMASEGFKILLRHPTTRLQQPKKISSLASQITIDQCIMGNLLNINDYFPLPKNFGLDPNKYFEEYFRKLMDNLEQSEQNVVKMFGAKGEEGQQGQSGGEGQEGEEGQEGQEGGKGNKDGKEKDGNGFQKFDNPKDALKDYFDPRGSSNDDWGKNDLMDADVNNMINDHKDSMKDWGKYTGNSFSEIVAANTPKISYKEVLRRFNVSVMSATSISSRMKINRRYDLQSPGYRRQYKSKVIFAVDCSGSMSDDDLKEGFAVVNSVCKHAEIHYLLFDTEIKQVETKMHKAKKSFKVTGRGGTDVTDVLKYARENSADGLVIYSDMYFSAPAKKPLCKVLWLSSNDQDPPVSWGFRAKLDRFEKH